MKKETVIALVAACRALDADLESNPTAADSFDESDENHGFRCLLIELENGMHFAAMALLGIPDEESETVYDPDRYLLKATTPEACDWVLSRIEEPDSDDCPECGGRNTAYLERGTNECHDCGISYPYPS